MTRPSDHYPRRCGCGHHAADPLDTITLGPGMVVPLDEVIRQILNDHPISLRDDLDALKAGLDAVDRVREALDRKHQVAGHAPECDVVASGDHGVAGHVGHGVVGPRRSDARLIAVRLGIQDPALLGKNVDALTHGSHDDSSTDAARAGIPDAAPTVEADTPTRAGIGVEDATTPAPSTSDDIVSVSITLTGDRQLVELVAALVIGGVK